MSRLVLGIFHKETQQYLLEQGHAYYLSINQLREAAWIAGFPCGRHFLVKFLILITGSQISLIECVKTTSMQKSVIVDKYSAKVFFSKSRWIDWWQIPIC